MRKKRNRYRVVYSRLYEFERYMRSKGVDVDLTGNPDPAEQPVDIVVQTGKQVVRSFVFWGIEHNIDVMHRLGTERQFGNILEAARSEKDWKNVRAYLNMFNEYSIHLNHRQKEQTISFLYELLLNREGDIRRQAAALIGKMFRRFQRRIPERTAEKYAGSGRQDGTDALGGVSWTARMPGLPPDPAAEEPNSEFFEICHGICHGPEFGEGPGRAVREVFMKWFDGYHHLVG